MKQWVRKLLDQLDFNGENQSEDGAPRVDINDDRATLLYMLDVYSKHLFEIEAYPIRKARESFDEFAKSLLSPDHDQREKALFRLRQFFNSYRIEEYTYLERTFDDFKTIIWDFADQLADDSAIEKEKEKEVRTRLEDLREAVESNSINQLRAKSREFIDQYVEFQTSVQMRREKRLSSMQNNLATVKKKLVEANETIRTDHLTGAFNRRSFDEQIKECQRAFHQTNHPVTLLMLDIDFFKKINDTYGHDVGDFVLKECVRVLKSCFIREKDFVARVGGEEFAVLLPDYRVEHAIKKAQQLISSVRQETFVQGENQIKFTVSLGIAELQPQESIHDWMKRADGALYNSKNSGRDRFTVAPHLRKIENVA